MNRTALTMIAPDIFRKRLLVEGYFGVDVSVAKLEEFFSTITSGLGLRSYGPPIIHETSGAGRDINEGFDGFVPLIDSGIYIGVWSKPKFLSTIIYTCGEFDEDKAVRLVKQFFEMGEMQSAIF
jgi:S-adenosylmethionine decarboxylase